jgi:muramoyltetrapeptide carboxypeptidase LdcA involved in peptidoglycan recycling
LFSDEIIGEIEPCSKWTTIEWNRSEKITWTKNSGYEILQGNGRITGRLLGGCCGSRLQIMGTKIFPTLEQWKDSVIFLEVGTPYGTQLATLHQIRVFAAIGMFRNAKGIVCTCMGEEDINILLKVIRNEEG